MPQERLLHFRLAGCLSLSLGTPCRLSRQCQVASSTEVLQTAAVTVTDLACGAPTFGGLSLAGNATTALN